METKGQRTSLKNKFKICKRNDLMIIDKIKYKTANTDNMGKLFVTVFAFAPAPKTNS